VHDILATHVLEFGPAGASAEEEEIDPLLGVDFIEAFDNLVADSAQPTGAPSCCAQRSFRPAYRWRARLPAAARRSILPALHRREDHEGRLRRDTWHMARAQAASQAVASTQPSVTTLQDANAPFASADDALDVGSDFAIAFLFITSS
jgi:hypothetical protein